MRRLVACLVGFALLWPVCACGGHVSQPSVSVTEGPVLQPSGQQIYVFVLRPTGRPSGVAALYSVRDGHARRLGYIRFSRMNAMGSAAVEVTAHGITPSWDLPSADSASAAGFSSFPARSVSFGTAWAAFTATSTDSSAGQTPAVFWTQDRYVGATPSSGGTLCGGSLDAVVRASTETPAKTSYCLTITVAAK